MSLGSENGLSASDVALLSRNNDGSGYNNGWGGDGAWWIIVLFLFMWGNGGWGNGWGNGNNAGIQGALTRADLCQDMNFSQLENGVRGIQQGLCDGFYAQNNAINGLGMNMMQGFHGVDNAICNLGFTTQQGFNATQAAMMQAFNNLQAQLAQCCCDNRVGQMQIQNQMAADACSVQNALQSATRDVLENQNGNTRAILDALTAQRIEAKDQRIAEQAQTIAQLQLSASQQAQNAVLMAAMDANKADILRRTGAECPTPAYVVQPPTPVNFPTNCCGTFNGGGWGVNSCGGCGC